MTDSRLPRREFLARTALAAAGMAIAPTMLRAQQAAGEPLYRISLAQWSLNAHFFKFLGRAGTVDPIDPLEFGKTAKQEFGIEALEYVNQFYPGKAEDQAYIAELNKRNNDLGVKSLLIMVDNEGQIGAADEARRNQTVENHKKWVTMAKALGCHSIRVNAGSAGSFEEQQKLAADGLRKLTEFGATHDINVIVENHGGLSSNGEWLAGVMKLVNHPRCGTLPDFGNFRLGGGQEYDRYKGIDELMPFAKGLSAKTYAFDEKGNETTIDVKRIMQIALKHKYHGYVGVEFEGRTIPLKEGVKKTKALLERVRDELVRETPQA